MARGEWPQAAREITTARDSFRVAGHGDLAFAEHNLGIIAAATRDPVAALAHFDAAAAAYAVTIGTDAPGPIRLHVDRARARLATGDTRGARTDATTARTLARRANIDWIVEDVDALLAGIARASPAVAIDKRVPVEPTPALAPPAAPPAPAPSKPQPKRDVGVYGSSQGW